MHDYKRLFGIALTGLLSLTATPAAQIFAAETSVPLPFDTSASVQIVQGYNGGTHHDASVYGLDLVLTNGETSGAPVLAPFDGTVPWAFAPGEKTGCIEILAQDRRFGAMLCHERMPPSEHCHREVLVDLLRARGQEAASAA